MPKVFPINVKVHKNGTWSTTTQEYTPNKLSKIIQKPYLIDNDNYLLFHLTTLATPNVADTEYQTSLRRIIDVLKRK